MFHTRTNPNQVDETTGKIPNNIRPAFTDELGDRYWMASIGDGIRHYTIDTPSHFNILELVKRNILLYQTFN